MNIQTNNWVFQDTSATGNGTEYKSGRNDQLTIYITGTSNSRTIHFEGCDSETTPNWYSIPAIKLPELSTAISTTGNNEAWVINLAQWVGVRWYLSAIAGGTVKITGRVVDSGTSLLKNLTDISGIETSLTSLLEKFTSANPASVIGTVGISGNKITEQKIHTDANEGVVTFADNINAIEIYNTDTTNNGVFTVNGISLNVPKGVLYRSNVGGTIAKTVTVSGSTTYIVSNLV